MGQNYGGLPSTLYVRRLYMYTAELVGGHYGSRKCGCYDKVEDVTSKELHLTYDE